MINDACDSDFSICQGKNSPAYIHRQAVPIPFDIIDGDHKSSLCLSSMIVFNIALVNHLLSENMNHEEQRSMYLMRSIKLYELVCRMLQDHSSEHDSPLFMMVTINNMGVACQQFGDIDKSNQCFQYLVSALFLLSECQGKNHYDGINQQVVIGTTETPTTFTDGFFRNVSYLMTKECAAPAA